MSAKLEAFLARIYVDAEARGRFLADPRTEAVNAGLDPDDIDSVQQIDRLGLQLAATSLARKRQAKAKRSR